MIAKLLVLRGYRIKLKSKLRCLTMNSIMHEEISSLFAIRRIFSTYVEHRFLCLGDSVRPD